jgi:hypothetical protein
MARLHLPLANAAETLYRSTSMYMLAQYFLHNEGRAVDLTFQGLKQIYENIHVINTYIAQRLRTASKTDSSIHAIVQLDIYAMTFLGISEETLKELRYLFLPFLMESALYEW